MHVATFDNAREYLAHVLPWPVEGGGPAFCNIHWSFKSNRGDKPGWSGRACKSVAEAVNAVQFALRGEDTLDIYACMSSQRAADAREGRNNFIYYRPIRNQGNAVSLKSLFLDIDWLKGGDHGYDTPAEAIAEFTRFTSEVGLPAPSLLVQSGGGMHVYWTMMRPLPPSEWAPLAFALAEATKRHNLKCDTQCTIDSARILRIPDTFNRKSGTPRQVKLSKGAGDYTIERLASALEPYKTIVPSSYQMALPPRVALQGESDLASGIDTSRSDPIDLGTLIPVCGFIRDAVTSGGKDYPNPIWNLTTLISTFCDDGRTMAHLMARKHSGYTRESTDELYDRKARERAEKSLGWPQCATISASGVTACQSCPLLAHGKSPLNHGSRARPTPTAVTGAAIAGGPIVHAPAPKDLPEKYVRDEAGLICRIEVDEDGVSVPIPISDYRADDPWLQENPLVLHFTTVTDKGRTVNVSLPFRSIAGMDMRATLQEQGFLVPVGARATEHVARFFMAWIKKLQATRDSVSSSPFGWSEDRNKAVVEGFVFAGRLWTPNGDRPAANPDLTIARHYQPSGEAKPWVDAAKMITDQGRPDLEAIVASAFAAPLVHWTGQFGVLMSTYSVASGIGKSTALKVAQSVWGDPVRAIQSLGDTQNSTMNKLGELKSLPLYWDELKTDEDTRRFVNLTFQVAGGKEKSRLTSQVKQREPGSWQTLVVSCSNDSILDYVVQQTSTTTAGLMRVFEYAVAPVSMAAPGQLSTSDASLMVAKLHRNYGQIGTLYAKWLGENFHTVATDVDAMLKEIEQQTSAGRDERFWVALIAVIVLGARYATRLGFAKFDEAAIRAFMVAGMDFMRTQVKEQPVDMGDKVNVSSLLNRYLTAQKGRHMLFTNRVHVGQGRPPAGHIRVIGDFSKLDGIYVHVGIDDRYMRISSAHFGQWLKDHNIPRHVVITAMEKQLGLTKSNGRLGAGTGNARVTGSTEHLLEIDMSGSPIADFIEDI